MTRRGTTPDARHPPGTTFASDGNAAPDRPASRELLLARALWLVCLSVAFGAISGALSITVGLIDGSLAVFGVGLGVLADLAGSAVLIWRFRAERQDPAAAKRVEARAAVIVAAALALISAALTAAAIHALVEGTHPGDSVVSLFTAAVSIVVLTPLAYQKRRTGAQLSSRALQGDGTLSAIGATTALLALIGLLLYRSLGWWWTDRVAALIVAAIAATQAYTTTRPRHD